MIKNAELCVREPRPVHDARMHQLVQDDDVVLARERRDGADGGGVTAAEGQGGRGALVIGQCLFQHMERRQRAADEPRRARARAMGFHGLDGGFLQRRMIGEAEVIIGGKIQQRPAVHRQPRALGGIDAAQLAEQVLLAQGGEALFQFLIKVRHKG